MAGKVIHVLFQAVLLLVFYLVLTPVGILLRALGKDYLSTRTDPGATTYWISR
jgi:hypothetical protein